MPDYVMGPYDDALAYILENGVEKGDRTGVGCVSVAGLQTRYRLDGRFPLLTRRKIYPKSIFAELVWFLSGSTNVFDLNQLGSKVWDPWRSEEFEKRFRYKPGELGPVYGFQLRCFGGNYHDRAGGFDQLEYVVNELKTNPTSRRIMFDLWNPLDLNMMRLPPCHFNYQIVVTGNRLTGILTQRSADYPVGVPANVQFYSALTMMFAKESGFQAFELVHNCGDAHIYLDQIDAVNQYLATPIVPSPTLTLRDVPDFYSYRPDDFLLKDFKPGPKIDIPVAV